MTQPEPHRITVNVSPPYDIVIGSGTLLDLPEWLASRGLASRYALITDTQVERLHASAVREALATEGIAVETIVIPAGEAHKTRATKEHIEDALAGAGMGRDGALLALGGGVVGDLAGFAAATWNRGIPWVQIPTTLLAMVDASVGGKTGVDHPAGKNLIGAFHQPAGVFADVDFLGTLSDREFRSGLAEVVKCGIIRDAALFAKLAAEPARLSARAPDLVTELITAAVRVKAEVVAADEREGDLRQILNFGHTIGHALELASGYGLTHGEAVSIGMVAEARVAMRLGLLAPESARAIEASLARIGLPVRVPRGSVAGPWAILDAARHDKKARAGRIVYVLPASVGEMARGPAGYGIPLEDVLAAEVLGDLCEGPD
ncbi:MAG: 3-dehydroquinate synthase [Candidatus Polarisedimenticolia bacterium]